MDRREYRDELDPNAGVREASDHPLAMDVAKKLSYLFSTIAAVGIVIRYSDTFTFDFFGAGLLASFWWGPASIAIVAAVVYGVFRKDPDDEDTDLT